MNKTRALGSCGESVSTVGFGAWAIGGKAYGVVEPAHSHAAVAAYLECGGRFIDTARGYGTSEEIIGKVLAEIPEGREVFVASKTGKTSSYEDVPLIREEVETSLRNVKRETIDLYFIHNPPADTNLMHEVIGEFEHMRDQGKIRFIGASIKGPNVTDETVDLCKQYVDTGKIDAIQCIYSILRQKNRASIEYALQNGVGIVARTVLESGFLTGKFDRETQFEQGDHRTRWNNKIGTMLAKVEDLKKWAIREPYATLSQVAMRYALIPPGVSTIIPGGKNSQQVRANMAIMDLPDIPTEIVNRFESEFADYNDLANTD